jgi:hypothetical protein
MSYNYQTQRQKIFTEEGQRMFLAIRDRAKELLAMSGAVMSGNLMIGSGNSWDMIACQDRLVELGELVEIPNPVSGAGQYRIFIAPL